MKKVLEYFTQISQIPRATFCEKKIAEYICNFAKEHNLEYVKDSYNNVLVTKIVDDTKKITVLQSHLDMVCIKEPNYDFDFKTSPLKLKIKGDYLFAHKTSLGADNGIGVAIILALLDSCNFNIQALFTTDEEVTMTGAQNFDYSLLKSKDIISLDGFKEDAMILGCASICDSKIKLNSVCNELDQNQKGYKLTVSGLKGGHSGADIHKKIGNAVKIMAEILNSVENINLQEFEVGDQFNFIPNYGYVCFSGQVNIKEFNKILNEKQKEYKGLKVKLEQIDIVAGYGKEFSKKLIEFINKISTGVIVGTSQKIVLSQNLSCVSLSNDLVKISNRSHDENAEKDNINFNMSLCEKYGFNYSIFDKQPGFETLKDCQLVKKLLHASNQLNYKLKPINKHISIEGCVFKNKLKDANIVVVSPTIKNPHSTKERVYLPSIQKTINLLKAYFNSQS